jgi:mannosyltransferase OCH1-like enzyme
MSYLIKKIYKKIKKQTLKFTETPFCILKNREAFELGREQKIPKNVYQTFMYNKFGKTHFKELNNFRNLNEELNFFFYDEDKQDAWMADNWLDTQIYHIYKKLNFGPARADIFRYCILYTLGGYYFDISKGCLVPLISLHTPESECLITFESNDVFIPPDYKIFNILKEPTKYIVQWGFGFAPGHPFLEKVIENIEKDYPLYRGRKFLNPKAAILMFTGPGQFTKSVRQVLNISPNINFTQAGIDFNQKGIFAMKGSEARYLLCPAYAETRNTCIVD